MLFLNLSRMISANGAANGAVLVRSQRRQATAFVSSFATSSGHNQRLLSPRNSNCDGYHDRYHDGYRPSVSRRMSSDSFCADFNNVVSSTKSNTVKRVQALVNKRKKRLELGQTVVEGPRMVLDLLENPKTRPLIRQVLVSTDDYSEYARYLGEAKDDRTVQLVTPQVLKACCDTVTPQGIVAIVDIPSVPHRSPKHPLYLVLDAVSDPGNVGTLIRSSLAVGVAGIILLPECCDVWNPKAVRSAMGASFQLPILEASSWNGAVQILNEWGVHHIYAATMITDHDRASQAHFDIDWLQASSALVIGSEGTGLGSDVRQALLETSDDRVRAVHVPMQEGIESLNAAVCGSVILFEYMRQSQTSPYVDH
jgi:TrmH family RNA methyltransferase